MAESSEQEGAGVEQKEERETQDLEEDFVTLGGNDESDDNQELEDLPLLPAQQSTSYNPNDNEDLPPWMSQAIDQRRTNHLVALHNEIVGFCKLMEPQESEMKEREQLVERFKVLVQSEFEDCQVDVFGSQATGLCLPSSDIDISIQLSEKDSPEDGEGENSSKDKKEKNISLEKQRKDMEEWDTSSSSPLERLAGALRENWIGELSYLEVIANTRVPLVKFTHSPTNISVDVCFNQKTGPQAAKLMHQYMDALPPLRPLTFVLKYFMASRGLNQPYTGGVGSFMLQMMIVSFLQHRERDSMNNRRQSQNNLGALLVEFLELYSTDFNYATTGLSVRFDGFYFPKGASDRKKDFWNLQRPMIMAMENPLEPTANTGQSSFRIDVIRRSFETAFKVLLSCVTHPLVPTVSILGSILPASEEMVKRSTLTRLKALVAPRESNSSKEPPRKRQRR